MSEPLFALPAFSGPALCAEVSPEVWFPDKGGSVRQAKAICGRCEIRLECADWAIQTNERHGVWGGLSEWDRRQLRKGRSVEHPSGWRCTTPGDKARVRELDGLGWSIEEIAADLDVSTRTVHRILARLRTERGAA